MIIVNTTFCLHPDSEAEILNWIKSAYIPSAIKCGAQEQTLLSKVIEATDPTFALHITFPTIELAKKWNQGVGQNLRDILAKRHGERALTFYTLLEPYGI